MPTKVIYKAAATASGGGREGTSKTHDGALDVTLAPPKEMGGSGDGVNPEQLFATGYAACFLGAMRFYASNNGLTVPDDAKVTVHVGIGPREDPGFGLDVEIEVDLPGVDDPTAAKLIEGGHGVCPYSHATKGSLSITPKRAA